MAVLANKTKVLAGGYDLSEFLTEVGASSTVDAKDSTTFGKAAKTYKAGIRDATLDADGFYDQRGEVGGTADALDDVLPAALGGPQTVVTVVKELDSFGAFGYAMLADVTKYEIKAKLDDLVAAPFSMQGSGKDRIVVLHALANEAATGNGTDHDDGASSTKGAAGFLHVTNISAVGGDTLDVKIQHSVDGIAWVDLITFTQVALDHKAERVEVAAGSTINRHIRAIWTLSAGADATFHVAFARRK